MHERAWDRSAETAYAVGLIATDGCLDGRRPIVSFTSAEIELIEEFRRALGRRPRIYRKRGRFSAWTNQVAIYDRPLHVWLLSIGLMPRKTFQLSGISVPDEHLASCARGLLDGDGSILSYWHVPNRRRYPNHKSLRLYTRFYSASRPLYKLEFAKSASRVLLTRVYVDSNAPHLKRKHDVWRRLLADESVGRLHTS